MQLSKQPCRCTAPAATPLQEACSTSGRITTVLRPVLHPWPQAPRRAFPMPHAPLTLLPHAAPAAAPTSPHAGLHAAAASGRVGVVIVDHGSRKAESNLQLLEFAQLFQTATGAPVVECAHMEIAEPTIEQAIGKCAARGVDTVVVAPYFLSRGRHIQEDIPQLVREAQAKHAGVRCVIADPIGIDPLMAQLICNRVNAAIAPSPAAL